MGQIKNIKLHIVTDIKCENIFRSKMPPKSKKIKAKKVAPAPYTQASKPTPKKAVNVLIEKRPKNFAIGADVQPTRDLTICSLAKICQTSTTKENSLPTIESASISQPVHANS